jgi:hypothetical protein
MMQNRDNAVKNTITLLTEVSSITGKDVNSAVVLSKMYTKEHQPQIVRYSALTIIYIF